jgi:hypothetical protein
MRVVRVGGVSTTGVTKRITTMNEKLNTMLLWAIFFVLCFIAGSLIVK